MKLVIESTDAIFGRVLELLTAPVETPQRDWAEEAERQAVAAKLAEEKASRVDMQPAPTPTPPSTDTAGIPWDRRIHAETKAKNTNGTWRYRRGVDKELVATVEAEYKQAAAAPEPPLPPPVWGAPPPPPVTFADAMSLMARLVANGKTTSEAVNAYCKSIGVPNLIAMSARPDLVPGFNEWLGKL